MLSIRPGGICELLHIGSGRAGALRSRAKMTALDGRFPRPARMLVTVVSTAGFLATLAAIWFQPPSWSGELAVFAALTVLASFARVPLPLLGSLSLAYALVLAGMIHFGAGASTLAAVLGAASSSLFDER